MQLTSIIIYYISLLYAFIIPLSRAGIVGVSALLIFFWIIEGRWKEKWKKLKECKVFLAISIFIIYNFISILWTDLDIESLKYISKYWYFLPIFVIFTSFPKEKSGEILTLFLFGILISEILSYGIFFELWILKHGTPGNPTPFMNHLDYSIFLAFTSTLLLIKLLNSENIREKLIYLLFFLTVSGNLFIIAGRSGQLAFFVALIILMFSYFRKNILKSIFTTISISILALITPMLLSDTFKNRIMKIEDDLNKLILDKDYNSSLGRRIGAWEVASEIIVTDPILGVGNQDNIAELKRITTEKISLEPLNWFEHFHNQYLEITTSLGFLGLFIFLNIFLQIYNTPHQKRENYLIKTIFVTIFLVGFIAEPFLHKQFTMALFSLILGYILVNSRSTKPD